MQGQIDGTHYNALLIGMVAQALMAALCGLLLAVALRRGRGRGAGIAAG